MDKVTKNTKFIREQLASFGDRLTRLKNGEWIPKGLKDRWESDTDLQERLKNGIDVHSDLVTIAEEPALVPEGKIDDLRYDICREYSYDRLKKMAQKMLDACEQLEDAEMNGIVYSDIQKEPEQGMDDVPASWEDKYLVDDWATAYLRAH